MIMMGFWLRSGGCSRKEGVFDGRDGNRARSHAGVKYRRGIVCEHRAEIAQRAFQRAGNTNSIVVSDFKKPGRAVIISRFLKERLSAIPSDGGRFSL